jgi:predicted MFS family arabinose efflux permease
MIGRMLFAIISGQMLGSVVSGFANVAFGWHSSLFIATGIGLLAALVAWTAMPAGAELGSGPVPGSFSTVYARIFANPKAAWLYGSVMLEGALFYGLFPFMGELLLATTVPGARSVSVETGLVLGAFGIGGIVYAASVRVLLRLFGVRRMCLLGSMMGAACYAALAVSPVWWLDAAAMFCAGTAFYMLHNSMQTEATELLPAARGSAVALFACGFFSGQGLGPLIFGPALHAAGPRIALVAVALTLVVLGRVVVAKVIGRTVAA